MCCVCGPVVVQGEVIEEQLLGQGGQGDELLLNEEIESVPESNIGEGFWTALAGIPISPELPFPDVLLDL